MRGQRGQALPLVLIFLTVGTLMITPALTYTGTGLHSQRISEEQLVEQDTSDAAVVDAIWQILEEAALTKIDDTGTYAYDFEFGLDKWGVSIEIPSVGSSEWQQLKPGMHCKIEVFPNWLETQGEETFYYVFRLDMPQWDGVFSFFLPLGLEYDTRTAVDVGPDKQSEVDPDTQVDHVNSQYWRDKNPTDWQLLTARYVEVEVMPPSPDPATFYLLKEWGLGNSSTWSSMSSGTTNNLNAVWGSDAADVYAVGDSATILRYTNSTWSTVTDSGTPNDLNGVWGDSTNLYAVGAQGTIVTSSDGDTWTSMTSGTTNNLNAVWGSDATDVYAVGDAATILHYTNSTWSTVTDSGTPNDLNGVWGDGTNLYAVGAQGTIVTSSDGDTWTTVTASGTANDLDGVWGDSTNLYAVGAQGTIVTSSDGDTWTSMSSGITEHLNGVWGRTPSDVFAVGASGTILHYDGSNWSSMTSGTTSDLRGVWPSSSSDVFAVGYSGSIRHYECRHKLTWMPSFAGFTGKRTYILVFQATGTLDWGIHYLLPEFTESGEPPVELQPTAGIASAMYNIIIDAGDQTISAVIGFTAEGEVQLISYQVIS